jgi:hypothetical protein
MTAEPDSNPAPCGRPSAHSRGQQRGAKDAKRGAHPPPPEPSSNPTVTLAWAGGYTAVTFVAGRRVTAVSQGVRDLSSSAEIARFFARSIRPSTDPRVVGPKSPGAYKIPGQRGCRCRRESENGRTVTERLRSPTDIASHHRAQAGRGVVVVRTRSRDDALQCGRDRLVDRASPDGPASSAKTYTPTGRIDPRRTSRSTLPMGTERPPQLLR